MEPEPAVGVGVEGGHRRRYRSVRTIGKGAFGTVSEALDTQVQSAPHRPGHKLTARASFAPTAVVTASADTVVRCVSPCVREPARGVPLAERRHGGNQERALAERQ